MGARTGRGLHAAWAQAGPSVGTLLATGSIAAITLGLSADDFQSWGWRIPFLASIALVGFGLWLRSGVDETPMFRDVLAQHAEVEAPLGEVLRKHWRRLLIAGGSRIGSDVMYSLLAAFTLTYLTAVLHQSRSLAVGGLGALAGCVWGFAFFRLLETQDARWIALAVTSGFFIHAFMYGPQAAFITEQFPTRVRYVGASLAYTWVGILGGGIAPLAFSALLRCYGSSAALSWYLGVALGVTGIALLVARETAHLPLEQ